MTPTRAAVHAARAAARGAGDDAEARSRVLADAAEALLAREPTSGDWVLLAAAWDDAGDPDTALHYLAHARASATDADARCLVALGHRRLGSHELAAAVMHEAELAAIDTHAWCTLASFCRAPLGDDERADACLARARAAAISPREVALVLAQAGDHDVEALLARAEQLASGVTDWIDTAAAYARHLVDPDEPARCLDRAEELAVGDDDRRRVQLARYRYASGPVSALGTHRAMRTPAELVPRGVRAIGWDRDPSALLDHLRARVSPERLAVVARNDYGHGAAENIAELATIAATGCVPSPLWQTLEILQLERWTDPDSTTVDHPSRALACTLLLVDDVAGGSAINEGNAATLAVLVESCLALGDDVLPPAIAFVAAIADAASTAITGELGLFAELALAILAARRDDTDPRLEALVARLDDAERFYRRTCASSSGSEWVLGTTLFSSRHHLWRYLMALVPALAERLGVPYTPPGDGDDL